MLQAYVDDSASDSGSRRLFLAGYINTADKWIRFSEAWTEELRQTPSISYLKMKEANGLSGEFQRWQPAQRDKKLNGLARVIRHFNPASIHCSISREDCKSILSPSVPYGFANPYFHCFQAIMVTLANAQVESRGVKTPINFIFDEQGGVGEDARFFYDYIRNTQALPIKNLLSANPVFADDKQVMPLQAADMLAWHIRRRAERDPTLFQVPEFLSADGLHMATDINKDHLERVAAGMSRIPGAAQLRDKRAWNRILKEIAQRSESGIRPPHLRAQIANTLHYVRHRIVRIFRS